MQGFIQWGKGEIPPPPTPPLDVRPNMQQHLSYKPSAAPEATSEGLNLKTFLGTAYHRPLQAVCFPLIFPLSDKNPVCNPDKYKYVYN